MAEYLRFIGVLECFTLNEAYAHKKLFETTGETQI